MKTTLFQKLRAVWILAALVFSFHARGQVTISDLGAGVTPTPGAYDIFQLSTNGEAVQPDGLNYTTDNGPANDLWAGQTFTTGSNCAGYTLNSIAIYTAGLTNSAGYATSQLYNLYVFVYSGFIYNGIGSFQATGSFVDGDWVRWDGLASSGLTLLPNTQYAFVFGRDPSGQGSVALGNASVNPYSGGELILMSASGGAPVTGSSHGYDATFDIGLTPIAQAPTITVDPSSESLQVYPGHQVFFNVGVCPSAAPLAYQWILNGTTVLTDGGQISGSQTATLTIAGVVATNGGSYSVIVSNSSGSVPSGSATLTVLSRPAAATYAAMVLSNNPIAYYRLNEIAGPIAYEFINGANGTYQQAALVGQPGLPNPPYLGFETTNLSVGCDNTQVGSWTAAPFGSLGVSNVTFTCWVKPIGTQNYRSGLIFDRSGIGGSGAGLGTVFNPPSLNYTWNNNNNQTYYFEPSNMAIPTNVWSLCAVAISPTNAVLYVLNQNGFNAATNSIPHTPDTVSNQWEIGNDANAADSSGTFNGDIGEVAIFTNSLSFQQMQALFQAGYSANMAPPTISVQPVPELLLAGRMAKFSVTSASLGAQTYRWLFNGTPLSDGSSISGSATSALYIQNVQSTNVGSYSVIVANQGGSTTSSNAMLSLAPSISTAYEAAMTSLNPVGYWRLNEASGATYAFDTWGGFTGTYGSAAVEGQAGPEAPTFPGFEASNDSVQISAVANSEVAVPPLQLNTNCVTITAWVYPTSSETGSAGIVYCRSPSSSEAAGLTCGTSGGTHIGYTWHNDVNTYHWVPSLTVPLNMWSFCALVIEPTRATIYVYNTQSTAPGAVCCAVNYYTHIVQTFNYTTYIGTDIGTANGGRAYKGDIDEVGIFNRALASSDIANLYTTATGTPLAPSIVLQPQATGVYSGGTAKLAVNALGGSGTPVYQWLFNGVNVTNGYGISGANTATLTITNAGAVNVGNYSVIVANGSGSVTSAPAILTVGAVASAYESAVLALRPLAYYRLDETNGSIIASDYAGGFDGTYNAAAVAGAAGLPNPPFEGLQMTNAAVQLTKSVANSFVNVPFGPLGIPNVTIMCWCYPMGGAQVNKATLVFSRSVPPGAGGLQYYGTTQLGYTWNQNNANTYHFATGPVVHSNTWSMCAMVISPTNCVLYVFDVTNGLQSATNAIAHSADGFGYPGLWEIGNDSSIANGGGTFNGMISQVAVFPTSLTSSQLLNLCSVAVSSKLTIQKNGTNVSMVWPLGTLQEAPVITGPWTGVTTNSPYTNSPTGNTNQFYRVRVP